MSLRKAQKLVCCTAQSARVLFRASFTEFTDQPLTNRQDTVQDVAESQIGRSGHFVRARDPPINVG